MNELLAFIVRNSKWFVFVLLATASCVLLFRGDPYRQHIFTTSAGAMASGVYKGANELTSYFNLHEINEDLNRRNAELQAELSAARERPLLPILLWPTAACGLLSLWSRM